MPRSDLISPKIRASAKLASIFRISYLRMVLKCLEFGIYDISDGDRKGIKERVNELIALLMSAHDILRKSSPDALSVAAGKLATIHYITGIAWHEYLANADNSYRLMKKIDWALRTDALPVMKKVSRLLAAQPEPSFIKRNDAYILPCSACGSDAVNFLKEDDNIRFNRLSPINVSSNIDGEQADRFQYLIENNTGQEAVDFLVSPGDLGFDNYCPVCRRVFCKAHFAVETEWSGSWHTATFATCPLGHQREIE